MKNIFTVYSKYIITLLSTFHTVVLIGKTKLCRFPQHRVLPKIFEFILRKIKATKAKKKSLQAKTEASQAVSLLEAQYLRRYWLPQYLHIWHPGNI